MAAKPPAMQQKCDGSHRTRIAIQGKQRWISFPTKSKREAERAAEKLRKPARAGASQKTLQAVADLAADPKAFDRALKRAISDAFAEKREARKRTPTFEQVAKLWTSGKLAKQYPDHVAQKDSGQDESHLKVLNQTIGKIEIGAFTLDDADRAMAKLPESARSPSTRRHYAQVIRRVLQLAVYPLRHREANPIPKGWLPRVAKLKAKSCLYPSEESALLACETVPIARRMRYGFAAREGMRQGELLALTWADVDVDRGIVKLDENKTDAPRSWALDPGTARALQCWRELRGNPAPTEIVFPIAIDEDPKFAETLRADLKTAGVTRPELFEATGSRLAFRFHDLRGTFVTLALANGRSETWVADRTGHTTSAMINRYRQAARNAAEVKLGWLGDMAKSIPELRKLDQKLDRPAPRAVNE